MLASISLCYLELRFDSKTNSRQTLQPYPRITFAGHDCQKTIKRFDLYISRAPITHQPKTLGTLRTRKAIYINSDPTPQPAIRNPSPRNLLEKRQRNQQIPINHHPKLSLSPPSESAHLLPTKETQEKGTLNGKGPEWRIGYKGSNFFPLFSDLGGWRRGKENVKSGMG